MVTRVSLRGVSREQWLQMRKKTIGGSDAAGIIGLSKWSSPYSVWADKTGRLPDTPDNEAMRQGRDLEEYVAQRFTEASGKRVKRVNAMLYNSDYPFAHADIDRAVVGESAGLECKTTSTLDLKRFGGVEFPERYYTQCVHYLAVTGYDRWYLAVLVLGKGFYVYTLERDEAEISALMRAEGDFWKYVSDDTPPPIDGTDATADTLQAIYPGSTARSVDLFGREEMLTEYMMLKEQLRVTEKQLQLIENTIKGDMADAEVGGIGRWGVSWKSQTRQTFDYKAFAAAHPELDLAPFMRASSSRPFKVTEHKKEAV